MLLDDIKVFQVTDNWTVFRIPITELGGESDGMYLEMKKWLEENCLGTYKLFMISHGFIGNSSYRKDMYSRLLEVDLLLDIDVVAFKLRWS